MHNAQLVMLLDTAVPKYCGYPGRKLRKREVVVGSAYWMVTEGN